MELKKIVFRNASAVILGAAVNLAFSAASSVLLVRYLGSMRLGQYASVYAYLTLFNWLTIMGMDHILVRELSKQREGAQQLFNTAVIASFVFSVIAIILAMLGSIIFDYGADFQTLLFIAAIDMLLLMPLRLANTVFLVHLTLWYATIISFLRQALWLIIIAVFIFLRANLPAIIAGRLFCGVIEALAVFLFAQRFLPFKWHFRSPTALKLLKNSWPLALSALFVSIYQRIDQVMLHILSGNQKLGYYSAAVNIAELFTIFSVAVMAPMFPILSGVVSEKERFDYYTKICFRYLMSFLFGICLIITLGSPLIIKILYGREFILSAKILAILIWSEAGIFLGMIIGIALIAQGLQRFIPLTTFIAAVINIILNALWIPKWEGVGAAWATVISYNLAGFFLFLLFPPAWNLCIRGAKASIMPLFIALSCVAIFGFMPRLIALPSAIILYAGGLFVLGFWNKEDMRVIFNAVGSSRTKHR